MPGIIKTLFIDRPICKKYIDYIYCMYIYVIFQFKRFGKSNVKVMSNILHITLVQTVICNEKYYFKMKVISNQYILPKKVTLPNTAREQGPQGVCSWFPYFFPSTEKSLS